MTSIFLFKYLEMKKISFLSAFILLVTTCIGQEIDVPLIKNVVAKSNEIIVSWDSVAHADGYEVIVSAGKKDRVFYVGNCELVLAEDIIAGNIYHIYLRAYRFDNAHSRQIQYVLLTPPLALEAKIIKNGFVAKWNRKVNVRQYYFYVATDKDFTQIVTPFHGLMTNKKTFKVSGIDKGKSYYYRVKTIDLNGVEHFSNTIQVNYYQ